MGQRDDPAVCPFACAGCGHRQHDASTCQRCGSDMLLDTRDEANRHLVSSFDGQRSDQRAARAVLYTVPIAMIYLALVFAIILWRDAPSDELFADSSLTDGLFLDAIDYALMAAWFALTAGTYKLIRRRLRR